MQAPYRAHQAHGSLADVARAQRTAQHIRVPPPAHLMRPQARKPSAAKARAKAKGLHLGPHIDRRAIHTLTAVRAILITLIFLLNGAIIALIVASLALGTGGAWEALSQIPNWIALVVIALFLIHRLNHRMFNAIVIRNLATFGLLTILGIINGILFTLRIQHGLLCKDFSGVEPHSCHAAQFMVAASWIVSLLATLGCLDTFFSLAGKPPEQKPVPLPSLPRHRGLKSPPPDRNPGTFQHPSQRPLFQCLSWGVKIDVNRIYPPLRPLYVELEGKYAAARAEGRVFPEEEAQKIRKLHLLQVFGPESDTESMYSVEQPAPARILDDADAAEGWVEIPLN